MGFGTNLGFDEQLLVTIRSFVNKAMSQNPTSFPYPSAELETRQK